jgi:AcrR family transcriptional regulator
VQQRAVETRRHLLDVAARAFAEHGYDAISLNAIIRDSGLTKGAFYFHFASKDELALATFRIKQEELIERLLRETGEQPDALMQLVAMMRVRARLLQEDVSLRCVLTLGAELGARSGPESEYAAFQETALDLIAGLIVRGQGEGVFRSELDPRRAAESVFGAIVGIDLIAGLLGDGQDLERRSEDLLEIIAHGLARARSTTA